MFGGEEATVFVCREFDFDPETRTARYRENALVRSGTDEVRAPLITLDEPGPGRRRMHATGGTASVLHPRAAKGADQGAGGGRGAQPRDAVRGGEEPHRLHGRRGDPPGRHPDAQPGGDRAAHARTAGRSNGCWRASPVEVHQGVRRATGERGTYTPATETFVLEGERVVLHDVDRRLEGRILTFEVGSDRIRVDGREEVRTEAVFRRKETPRP